MEKLVLNVYDDDDNVLKTVEASFVSLRYGTIQNLMKLLKVDEIEDTASLLKIVLNAWNEVTKLLNKCFPEMEEEDWENVKLDELIPVVINVLKGSFSYMLRIPQSQEKN